MHCRIQCIALLPSAIKHHQLQPCPVGLLHLPAHYGEHKYIRFKWRRNKAWKYDSSTKLPSEHGNRVHLNIYELLHTVTLSCRKRSNDRQWKIIANYTFKVVAWGGMFALSTKNKGTCGMYPEGGNVAEIKFSNWWLLINSPASILEGTKGRLSSVRQTCGAQDQRIYKTWKKNLRGKNIWL